MVSRLVCKHAVDSGATEAFLLRELLEGLAVIARCTASLVVREPPGVA